MRDDSSSANHQGMRNHHRQFVHSNKQLTRSVSHGDGDGDAEMELDQPSLLVTVRADGDGTTGLVE